MKAIQIQAFGKPTDVAQCVDIPDVGAPDANEVVVALEASPINQYDLLMIAGGYGYRPPLPAIVGTEGVGRVIEVGSGVKHLKEGDRTLVPFLHPAWAERVKTNALWLRPLPPGDVNQFAMMGVNPPTAYLLLTDIVKLPPGIVGDPEWCQFGRRARDDRGREIAGSENRQYRPSRRSSGGSRGARRRCHSGRRT
jgi:NADPH:quinone reductase-like Zn-dependent oxidoreductase